MRMQSFKKNIIHSYGDRGKAWLAEIPDIIDKLAKKYKLIELKPVSNMRYNYVAAGYQNDDPIILKLGLNTQALEREASCLKAFSQAGAARIFENDENMLIIERAIPGETLKKYFPHREDESIQIVCEIIKKLHNAIIPENHDFYSIRDLLQALDNHLDIPSQFLRKARKLGEELIISTHKSMLLHGDLHHDNILQNDDGWMVIDSKGFIGDPVYEVAAFIRNPIPELFDSENVFSLIYHRILHFSEILGYPKRRILDWCFVQAVLAWVWALEDGEDDSYFKNLTEFFDRYIDTLSHTARSSKKK